MQSAIDLVLVIDLVLHVVERDLVYLFFEEIDNIRRVLNLVIPTVEHWLSNERSCHCYS